MDVIVSRKIGAPKHSEYGIGAISEDEIPLFSPESVASYNITGQEVMEIVFQEKREVRRRVSLYRHNLELPDVQGRSVILVDDGLATGVTAAAAARYLRSLNPREIILAVPVGPEVVSLLVAEYFDEIIILEKPKEFHSVGLWYDDFTQVEDEEVELILEEHRIHPPSSSYKLSPKALREARDTDRS